ncbi:hypothetical protein AOL_s00188g175 [Orbilia oligospora ATCC 24927]|uniref:Uncharacterized protein n=1 Tax=Arthrobotrys oligospora (strain ATCC 24927 / CBS 115.81 / DSM 1491) TaxID=756982 RepID=G1XQG3_ARTOA|nr:hypothetical protein AOL_s00188g175 [Orbilia oligospora ATCC 24927]EGX44507.1 hypothetical protein AOL_s00188g175 [Orbilia oligospora ATCC 24927]
MARETEKDFNHTYFSLGERRILHDLGLPDYVTHSAERAYYYYRHLSQQPYVIKIDNYRNPIENILRKRGLRAGGRQWKEDIEVQCYECDCWVCPRGLEGVECLCDSDDDELEIGVEGWQGCRGCGYCVRAAKRELPLGVAMYDGYEFGEVEAEDDYSPGRAFYATWK